ncbi:hypothetical protein DV515_00014901 [Chloebia gouldiae]|uniref:Uncharacterized protein n=1 Tax=Chloebia gouldiae TaxID=44316 RepID=A0A3L8RWZ2_CHLGU|nr:hypothetical protein DV515_00014901 [Chloebia gouldiae]
MVCATHLDQSFMQIPAKPPPQALSQPSKENHAVLQLSDIKPPQGAQHSPGQASYLRLQGLPPSSEREKIEIMKLPLKNQRDLSYITNLIISCSTALLGIHRSLGQLLGPECGAGIAPEHCHGTEQMQLPVKPSPVGTHWQVTSAGFMPRRKQAALNPCSTWLTVPLTQHEPTQLPQQPWLLAGYPGHCQQSHLSWYSGTWQQFPTEQQSLRTRRVMRRCQRWLPALIDCSHFAFIRKVASAQWFYSVFATT